MNKIRWLVDSDITKDFSTIAKNLHNNGIEVVSLGAALPLPKEKDNTDNLYYGSFEEFVRLGTVGKVFAQTFGYGDRVKTSLYRSKFYKEIFLIMMPS